MAPANPAYRGQGNLPYWFISSASPDKEFSDKEFLLTTMSGFNIK
jgi:hypothetical protein